MGNAEFLSVECSETAETGRVQEMTRYESCLCSSLIESLSDVGAGRPE